MKQTDKLSVTSIFTSINGECCEAGQGSWTTFVRFFGCSKQCSYCDSKYSWENPIISTQMSVDEIITKIDEIKEIKRVSITGGEPLEQSHSLLYDLFTKLDDRAYEISIETNGLYSPHGFLKTNPYLSFILDYKLPSSGIDRKLINLSHYENLSPRQFVKFIISNEADFCEALEVCERLRNRTYSKFYFSPCIGKITPAELFKLMKKHEVWKYRINYNLQIHKFIFDENWRDEER